VPQIDADDGLFLQVKPWPTRALGADDVQVAVVVCGMNFSDLYTRQGMLRDLQPPLVLGTECAGEVTAVGASVTHIKVSRKCHIYNASAVCNSTSIFIFQMFIVTGRGSCQQLSQVHQILLLHILEILDSNFDQNRFSI
jgi:NADPH:quinone reductase-like Zn-dependent oxidoreductase